MKNKKGFKLNKRLKRLILLIFLAIVIIALVVLGILYGPKLFGKNSGKQKTKVVDEIKTFNYAVSDKDTKLFKKNFNELKKVLNDKEVDNAKYAEIISKLFIIDFFSLDNKSSKNDIGGVQFVYGPYKTDFIEYARNGIYKNVQNNIDGDSNRDLPIVDSVEVKSVDEIVSSTVFDIEPFNTSEEPDAYEVRIIWTYENSNDYQTSSVLTIVKDDGKLSIAKMTEN